MTKNSFVAEATFKKRLVSKPSENVVIEAF